MARERRQQQQQQHEGQSQGREQQPQPQTQTRAVPGPDSLLRCVSEVVYLSQGRRGAVRSKLVSLYELRPHLLPKIPGRLADPRTPAGLEDLPALSELYGLNFKVLKNMNDLEKIEDEHQVCLHLDKTEKQFQLVVSKGRSEIEGFCQSIVYKILYERVFEMANVDYAVNMLMNGRIALFKNNLGRREEPERDYVAHFEADGQIFPAGEKNCAKRLINNRILPFPYAAAKGLCENYNKNIPFDNWIESTDECGVKYFENEAIDVGDKCVCTLSNDDCIIFSGYIQDIEYCKGICTVFVLRLGETKKVNFQQIIPIFQHEKSFNLYQKKTGANNIVKPLENFQYKNKNFKQRIFKKTQEHNGVYYHVNNKINNFPKKEKFSPKIYDDDFAKNKDILNDYTCMEMNYHNFQPCEMNIILHPLSVEHDSHAPLETNLNDNVINNRQNYSTPKPATTQPHVYSMGSTDTPPAPTPYPSLPTTPLPYFPLVQQGNFPPQFTSPSNYPPIMYVPTPFPYPRPITPPHGINHMAQRSINLNGSDLPFHDIPTLRFFYNVGIDAFQASMLPTNSPRMITQVNVPVSNYQQTSPNQLAMEFQQGLTLDDSNQDINKNLLSPNNKNNVPRNRGTNESGNKFNRGGFHGRFKRNDMSDKGMYRNGQNTNKPLNNMVYNNNSNRTNTPRNNGKYNGNTPRNNFPDGSNGKDIPQPPNNNIDMLMSNVVQSPPIPYPPPPTNIPPIHYQYYRYPYCPDAHANIMSFPPPYHYNHLPSDDHSLPPPVVDNGVCFNPSLNMYQCTTTSSSYCPPSNFTNSSTDNLHK